MTFAAALLAILAGATAGLATSPDEARAESEPAIRFLEERVAADSLDPAIAVRLGSAYLQKAKGTGDVAYYGKAEVAFETALARSRDYFPALMGFGSTCLGQHRFREAVAVAERALAQRPDAAEPHWLRGDAEMELGDLTRAETAYRKAHALQPGLLSLARLAHYELVRGDARAAIEKYEAALRAGEESGAAPATLAWCLVKLGEARFRTGDWDAADRCYARAAELEPDDVAVLDHIGELHAARGQFDRSIAAYAKVVERSPRPDFLQFMGDILAAAGKSDEARTWHDRALSGYLRAAAAGSAAYDHHLAHFYSEVRPDGVEAMRWAAKDLALRRTQATLAAMASALHAAGKDKEAEAALDEALAQPTADAHLLAHGAHIYAEVARHSEAQSCLARAATINPRFASFQLHR